MGSEATAAVYGAFAGGLIALVGVMLAAASVLVGIYVARRLQERITKVRCVT